ncbi:MAG: alpha-amylase [Myxococcales bacterium]|nr:alpha-amylase [Myxococcales bacterium]
MLDAILDSTPADLRGWFALGLPVSRAAETRFDLADLRAPADDRQTAVWRLAERARDKGAESATPGEVLSGALVQSVLRYLLARHCAGDDRLDRALAAAREATGEAVDRTLDAFRELYPPHDAEPDNRRAAVELWLLALAAENPAMAPLRALFDDSDLRARAPAGQVVHAIEAALEADPGLAGEPLAAVLRAPMKASPGDLAGQLDYILAAWTGILPGELHQTLLRARDVVTEERRPRFAGPGPQAPISFAAAEEEVENFTPDRDWMSNVVLVAKLTHVWLDQLSKTHGRAITRLDEIPDDELDRLAGWGVNALWLIGLWERSTASRTIKQKMGNPEALSSAYALYDYVIAEDLGGEAAYEDLRDRARARGIRLAADMVPNHVGIDGRWVVEHPERFLRLDAPPYPNYRFTGPDLSPDDRVGVYLEDGYWTRTDAAVVFKRVDHATGEACYIYHGNDGTQMPWNDTAQIDYLDPDAREAVIQTILAVARRFSVIRFDAAMTLARRHIRRLWHPAPGDGGAIPSRAAHGVDPETFDQQMPEEFWREVVDRVKAEVPDTLLLAEAFWLMEGYFVRTLGMHRVYNSAFMHMLKHEDNAGFRKTIANTLAFSPEVLKRYVNFMNNPDEETAVEQFGRGDKYFGVATLLVTLPGLPMIGHGQVEGFAEKYGMEYRRAYRDEIPDLALIEAHERRIFPLIRRRHVFSEAAHFAMYDFETPSDGTDDNVFAYSNREGEERAIVVYNNAYASTRGRFRVSVPMNIASGGETELVTRALAEALALRDDETLYRFRDHVGGLWYLRTGAEITRDGLYAELAGYQCIVWLDFAAIEDADPAWHALAAKLDGAGVPDLAVARRALVVQPAVDAFAALLRAALADDDELDALEATLREVARPHGIIGAERLAMPSLDAISDADRAVHRVVAALRLLTPQGRLDAREVTRALADDETAALAEALTDGRLSGDPATVVDDFVAAVSTPAARAWLAVHTHEGVRWYRGERMKRLVAALLADAALADVDAAALAEAAKALRAHVDGARYRYDALIGAEEAGEGENGSAQGLSEKSTPLSPDTMVRSD